MKDSPAASLYTRFYSHLLFLLHFTALYCTILHFLNKIWEDELLGFVSASTLAMYGGTTDVKDSPAASLYTQFYSPLLFLLHFTAPYCTILHHTAPYCTFTAPYCTILHFTAPYCTLLHLTAPYCTLLHFSAGSAVSPPPQINFLPDALYCTLLHHTALYCTILHHTAPYCTILHFTAPYLLLLHS